MESCKGLHSGRLVALPANIWTRVEATESDQHSSFLPHVISYGRNKFYDTVPSLIFKVIYKSEPEVMRVIFFMQLPIVSQLLLEL